MDLTSKEAFRLGFLTRCAEEGLTGTALQARIKSAAEGATEKRANPGLTIPSWLLALPLVGGAARSAGNALYDIAQTGGALAVGAPAAAGLAAGGLGGYALAKFNEPNITDDDVKAQEVADTYRRYAQRLKIRRKLNPTYRQAR